MVNHRRGRKKSHVYAGPPDGTSRSHNNSSLDLKHTYAYVTRTGRSMIRGDVQRRYREPGYKPQFFDSRTRSGPAKQSYKKTNVKYTNIKTQQEKHNRNTTDYRHKYQQNDRKESDDPDFRIKTRVIHTIIKAVHHLKNVSTTEPPVTIDRLTRSLSTIIKPAAPNTDTQTLIEGNAKNWAFTTMLILRDHYTLTVETELDKLTKLSAGDWGGPFEIASSWAKRNLGRRLQFDTLEQVEALLVERLTDLQPITPNTGVDEQPRQTEVERRTAIVAARPPPQPPAATLTTRAQIHTRKQGHNSMTRGTGALSQPPDPHTHKTTTVTTTEILGGEDPETEVEGEEEEDYISPTPIQPQQPLPKPQRAKRTPRRKSEHHTTSTDNPCVAQGEDILLDLSSDELETLLEEDRLRTPRTGRLLPMDTPLAPNTVRRMETAVQSQINLGPKRQDHTPPTPETPTRKPTRHLNTRNKLQDWGLSVGKKWLIMGDSNVARVPPFTAADLQIDSYPGATFRHAEAILTRATSSVTVETVILSFGLNNRSQKVKQTTIKQLQAAVKTAKLRFPQAEVWVPQINYSRALPLKDQNNLLHLNAYITKNCRYIPELPMRIFKTETDKIHWTKPTARRMLQHWFDYVK